MAATTVTRPAKDVKNSLSSKLKVTYAELGEIYGIEKVTAQTPISGVDRTIISKITKHRDQANLVIDDSQKPQGVEDESVPEVPVSSNDIPRVPQPGSVGELMFMYKELSFPNLNLITIASWFPEFQGSAKKLSMYKVLSERQRSDLVNMFNVLMAVKEMLDTDTVALTQWAVPEADELAGMEFFSYVGICGHSTQISKRMMLDRMDSKNNKVAPFFRLCADCRAMRVALLNMVPGAAKADSVCAVCGDPTFNTGANGLALSRADLWENLLSDVMGVINLPLRLRKEHFTSNGKHKALVRNRQEFEMWKNTYMIQVGLAISAHPNLGAELKASMEGTIEAKRLELSLPADADSINKKGS